MNGTPSVEPRSLLTAEEFARSYEGKRAELVRGRVVHMSPPGWDHGDVATGLVTLINTHVKRLDLGKVLVETGYIIERGPDTVRGPDLSFVSKARIPSPRPKRGFPELAPDLAVEVVSPSDTRPEVEAKVAEYLAAGVREVWVVDPGRRRAEIHRAGAVRTLGHGDVLSSELLPGLEIKLADVLPAEE